MKKIRKGKTWIRRYWGTVWLLAVEILLLIGGSLAAYTSFSSVKRVVSTGESQAVLFSSNYLYLTDKDVTEYSARRVTPVPVYDSNEPSIITSEKFTVSVSNYLLSNPSAWNTQNIEYTLTATLIPINGGDLPENFNQITIQYGTETKTFQSETLEFTGLTLTNDAVHTHSFVVLLPAGIESQIKIQMIAKPKEESYSATNQQKLAAVLIMGELAPVKNWTGHFIDEKTNIIPYDYDGFNYEISGNGEGKVTLTWDYSKLELSPWFASDETPSIENGWKKIEFSVGGEDESGVERPTAYQTQFYWAAGAKGTINNMDALEDYVKVTFAAN